MIPIASVLAAGPFEVTGAQVLIFLGCAIALVVAYSQVLTAIRNHRETFGPKPSHDQTLAEIREEMRGLAPSEKVDKLIEGLASAATKQELAAVMKGAAELVRQEVDAHKLDVDRQLTEVRAYTHENIHSMREDIGAMRILEHNERAGIHSRLNAMTEVLFELRGRLLPHS